MKSISPSPSIPLAKYIGSIPPYMEMNEVHLFNLFIEIPIKGNINGFKHPVDSTVGVETLKNEYPNLEINFNGLTIGDIIYI